ncbi:MAG: hypothetical protein ACYTKD_06595 [Planctomycetota bacterium]|jgi:hypothetical protein
MSLVFRGVRKSKWQTPPRWFAGEGVYADLLNDLRTRNNKLSLWRVAEDRSDLDDVIAALATTKDEPSNIDYAVFPEACVDCLGISVEEAPGEAHLQDVNAKHFNLVEMTGEAVLALAGEIRKAADFGRKMKKDVLGFLRIAVAEGRLDPGKLGGKVKALVVV